MCQILWKLVETRQSYCNNKRVQFLAHPVQAIWHSFSISFDCYIVRNRFLSVRSQYGVTSCTISKCGIKDALWQSLSTMIQLWLSSHFIVFVLLFLALYFNTVFYHCMYCCHLAYSINVCCNVQWNTDHVNEYNWLHKIKSNFNCCKNFHLTFPQYNHFVKTDHLTRWHHIQLFMQYSLLRLELFLQRIHQ